MTRATHSNTPPGRSAQRPPAPPAPTRQTQPSGWLGLPATFWTQLEHALLLATFASIVLGVIAFCIDYSDRKEARRVNKATLAEIEDARKERQAEAITRAWSLITTPATGNSGKGPALEYLNDQGISLNGINLSCAHMGGGWDAEKLTCETPTYLRGVELKRADLSGAKLQGADLENAQLQGADLRFAQLQGASLRFAQLQGANLRNAQLQGAALWEAQLGGANLSKADFTNASLSDYTRFHDPETGLSAWAWADKPPTGLPKWIKIDLCVYDSKFYNFFSNLTRPSPCIPPDPAQ